MVVVVLLVLVSKWMDWSVGANLRSTSRVVVVVAVAVESCRRWDGGFPVRRVWVSARRASWWYEDECAMRSAERPRRPCKRVPFWRRCATFALRAILILRWILRILGCALVEGLVVTTLVLILRGGAVFVDVVGARRL